MSKKLLIGNIRTFVISRGGELLTKKYINNKQKLHVRCKCGHEWHPTWVNIKYSNSWCPKCSMDIRNNKLNCLVIKLT